jgi:hypothetical protein
MAEPHFPRALVHASSSQRPQLQFREEHAASARTLPDQPRRPGTPLGSPATLGCAITCPLCTLLAQTCSTTQTAQSPLGIPPRAWARTAKCPATLRQLMSVCMALQFSMHEDDLSSVRLGPAASNSTGCESLYVQWLVWPAGSVIRPHAWLRAYRWQVLTAGRFANAKGLPFGDGGPLGLHYKLVIAAFLHVESLKSRHHLHVGRACSPSILERPLHLWWHNKPLHIAETCLLRGSRWCLMPRCAGGWLCDSCTRHKTRRQRLHE